MGAQYLLRFDDICPGMNWPVWREVEKILIEADVKPMLAVVPSNRDETLNVGAPEPGFWQFVRDWQSRGWTVGLHGFEHRYETKDGGLMGINDYSEFSGLPAARQEEKLRQALEIFRQHGVTADVWIAPGHSFDRATLAALKALGITAISDGFFLRPHRDLQGMIWIPQQLWSFRPRPFGVWTVCMHLNSWTDEDVMRFKSDVASYRERIACLADVVSSPSVRDKAWHDSLASAMLHTTRRSKKWVKRLLGRPA